MAVRALYSSASGMAANSFNLDIIANNLANSSTTAYKQSRANFEDIFYEHFKLPGVQDNQGNLTPTGTALGIGTRVQSTEGDFEQGSILPTNGTYDLAIVGDGFFRVNDGTQDLYTRAGNFSLNANGNLVMASADKGYQLQPTISIPQDAINVSISGDGVVSYQQQGSPQIQTAGNIQIARFINNQGLMRQGDNLFTETTGSGPAQFGDPGTEGRGQVRQGFLEQSNVEPVRELVELIKTQRNFELNSQVVQAADQSLQTVANLRRF
ncbi:flagellar basal-body rod protein FlgG [Gimesia sp.]|uniref:flagellar basal-body rod protein FlgG n=1 Tax=Gimesia sp. TaxID=2024833 RepID=UPI000C3B639B|nr:flagellar basal-body rod protein FlgG [Gimesia sp.]MAX36125.1 flagellar basal-body rod protein FlgG [Gimesia sp.]HBL47132.1 flagellar basal-body rod protein FlgG [Planctomycetaceae bacterium]|tara:strand:+ start:8041 stop:8841 length:801 start_codon:yes stop_codon:yes gene_type:complete